MDTELRADLSRCGCHLVEKLLPRLVVIPDDEEAIAALIQLARHQRLRVCPTGSGSSFPVNYDPAPDTVFLLLSSLDRIVDLKLSDAMICVETGASVSALADKLSGTDLAFPALLTEYPGTIGGAVLGPDAGGLRHAEIRRRLLFVKIIDPQGRLLQFGSFAIKNVAGYDYWSFLIGTGGRFGVLTEVALNLEKMPLLNPIPRRDLSHREHGSPVQWIYAGLCKRLDPDGIFAR